MLIQCCCRVDVCVGMYICVLVCVLVCTHAINFHVNVPIVQYFELLFVCVRAWTYFMLSSVCVCVCVYIYTHTYVCISYVVGMCFQKILRILQLHAAQNMCADVYV